MAKPSKIDSRRDGRNPLSYLGVNAVAPSNIAVYDRPPTSADRKNVIIGDGWIDGSKVLPDLWRLVKLAAGAATWINLSAFNTNGTDGQVLIGGGTEALWANITTASGLVVVNEGANTLDLDLSGTIADIFQTDTLFAQPSGGVLEIAGGADITTSGSGNVVTIDVGEDVATLFLGDVGFATPLVGAILLEGGANVTTNASGAVVTFTATGGGGGGSANASFLAHQVADGGDPYAGGGGIYLGAAVIMTEVYDIGNNFTEGDGAGTAAKFTAPQDGKYLLQLQIYFDEFNGSDVGYDHEIRIETSKRVYKNINKQSNFGGSTQNDAFQLCHSISVVADMDALDTAEFFAIGLNVIGKYRIGGDDGSGRYQTFVSGSLEESDIFGFTEHAVLVGDATSGIGELPLGNDGQVIIGATGAASAFANITAGANITINEGANSLEIVSTGGGLGSSVSSFLAFLPTDDPTGPAEPIKYLGQTTVLTEVYDIGADFYPGDGAGTAATFTAPQDGKYQLNFAFLGESQAWLETSKRIYYLLVPSTGVVPVYEIREVTVVADMDKDDIAKFGYQRFFNGAAGVVTGKAFPYVFLNGAYQTYVSGTLV